MNQLQQLFVLMQELFNTTVKWLGIGCNEQFVEDKSTHGFYSTHFMIGEFLELLTTIWI